VMPNKLLADGFVFTHATLQACLSEVLATNQ
jgi:NAD dependent epimerase/dehydratase family enzyme